jgi:hypothetical protein
MEEEGEEDAVRGGHHVAKRARKNKSVVAVFDDAARTEYLTGFRKRKNKRRKVAEAEKQVKERQKRLQLRKEVFSSLSFLLNIQYSYCAVGSMAIVPHCSDLVYFIVVVTSLFLSATMHQKFTRVLFSSFVGAHCSQLYQEN